MLLAPGTLPSPFPIRCQDVVLAGFGSLRRRVWGDDLVLTGLRSCGLLAALGLGRHIGRALQVERVGLRPWVGLEQLDAQCVEEPGQGLVREIVNERRGVAGKVLAAPRVEHEASRRTPLPQCHGRGVDEFGDCLGVRGGCGAGEVVRQRPDLDFVSVQALHPPRPRPGVTGAEGLCHRDDSDQPRPGGVPHPSG